MIIDRENMTVTLLSAVNMKVLKDSLKEVFGKDWKFVTIYYNQSYIIPEGSGTPWWEKGITCDGSGLDGRY